MKQKKVSAKNEAQTATPEAGANSVNVSIKAHRSGESSSATDPGAIYQFQIGLLGTDPLVWRRIQVEDCTLDRLHEHIQAAMGWTNSHLYEFEIAGERYGLLEYLDNGFGKFMGRDATRAKISQILANRRKRFRFKYEYDFGDCWQHEITFQGRHQRDAGGTYPVCLEGGQACPPEDIGGVWGYDEFLEALADPKHERHEDILDMVGIFDPSEFDSRKATNAMRENV